MQKKYLVQKPNGGREGRERKGEEWCIMFSATLGTSSLL
jgi:hypothetical protein